MKDSILVRITTSKATAMVLGDNEKQLVWPNILDSFPQMRVYENRTTRNIGVFRVQRKLDTALE